MKLIEFLNVITELRIYMLRTNTPEGGFAFATGKRGFVKSAVLPNELIGLKTSPSAANKMYEQGNDDTFDQIWTAVNNTNFTAEVINGMEAYPKIFEVRRFDNPGSLFRYATTNLGLPVSTFKQLVGEIPEVGEADYTPFHNARVFFPEKVTDRKQKAMLGVLEEYFQHMRNAGLEHVFAGDYRFIPIPGRASGHYDPETDDMAVDPVIKRSKENIFTLLHETGHKFYFQFLDDATRDVIKEKFWSLRREGEKYKADTGVVGQFKDIFSQIKPGTEVDYVGREKRRKKNPEYVVKSIGPFKGNDIVFFLAHRNQPTVTADAVAPMNLLNKRKWRLPFDFEAPDPGSKYGRESENWFPTEYSEKAPENNLKGEEWFAELFAFYVLGNLKGAPAGWMKGLLDSHRQMETVGSNQGELNSEEAPEAPREHEEEEGNVGWEWTDPYHPSGAENAVMSRTP